MSKQEDRTQADAPGESGVQAPGRRRAADSLVDAPGRARPLEQPSGSTVTTSTDGLPSRRALRRAQQQSAALVSDATAQIARLQAAPGSDPSKVDPQVLAEQLALAERAAALNRRAGTSSHAPTDPTAAHNLGPAAAPAALAATTTAVPPAGMTAGTATGSTAAGSTAAGPTVAGSSPSGSAAGPSTKPGWQPSGSRETKRRKRKPAETTGAKTATAGAKATASGTNTGKANAAAPTSATAAPTPTPAAATGWVPVSGAARNLDDRTPLPAGSALGLDPLDAVTAGLGRTQRNRRISWGLAVVAVVALGTVLTLILTGFGH
jgi:hypothetical protein